MRRRRSSDDQAGEVDIDDRRKAEGAIRESEYKLRQIIDTVPSLVWATGLNGENTYANQRILDYIGARYEDFKNHGWQRFVHPDDLPETLKAFHHAIETGTSYETVHRVRRADGEFRWHRTRGEAMRDREGRVIQWYGLTIDVDEAKKAEERLRRSEAYLAEAQHLSHTGSFGWTPSTGDFHWSDETFRILEYDSSVKPTLERVLQRVHPDDLATVRQVIDDASRGGKVDITHRLSMPGGSVKFVHVLGYALKDAAGNLEIVGAVMDVTERKRAEEALRRGEAWFAQAQRLNRTGTWVMNGTTRRFLYWSDECYRIWGLDPLQGLPSREDMWGRIHPDDRERLWGVVQQALSEQRDFFEEFRILLPDGTVKYLEANSYHEFSPLGALLEVICTCVDVTERKRAQDERERLRQLESDLARMNRLSLMGELTASLAHEIKQPIGSACNNACAALNFLDEQPPELAEVREALDCVVADANRAGEIIDRIRDQVKKTPPRKDHFDLNAAINEVTDLARNAIIQNRVSVQTRLAETLFPIHGDRVQLQQVVMNLLLNAVEAMGDGHAGARELLISTEQDHNGVLVAVRDSGPGIDAGHLECVFDPFYTTKSKGMGMGLSICRSIIKTHGGRLWATACQPHGTLFQFTIPARRA
jgi:PAS domain S-box-containing protein